MKKFVGKTKDDALNNAAMELNVPIENIYIDSIVENKGLFGRIKKIKIVLNAIHVDFSFKYNFIFLFNAIIFPFFLCHSLYHLILKLKIKKNPNYNVIWISRHIQS